MIHFSYFIYKVILFIFIFSIGYAEIVSYTVVAATGWKLVAQ